MVTYSMWSTSCSHRCLLVYTCIQTTLTLTLFHTPYLKFTYKLLLKMDALLTSLKKPTSMTILAAQSRKTLLRLNNVFWLTISLGTLSLPSKVVLSLAS